MFLYNIYDRLCDKVERVLVEKWVSVQSLNKKGIHFFAEGSSFQEADQLCSFKIIKELYEFDVIKEPEIEFYDRRKVQFSKFICCLSSTAKYLGYFGSDKRTGYEANRIFKLK